MKILITGASGMIGRAATDSFTEKGHQVVSLQRDSAQTPYWDIKRKMIDLGADDKVDAVIHLAGENIAGGRWDEKKKERILKSRVEGTRLIADYFSKANYPPRVIISGSAVGFYGNRGSDDLNEESAKGVGFLSDVCKEWEDSTKAASQSGIRVVTIRCGMVLSEKGGALVKMLSPFRYGLGGIIGDGKQYMSWITLDDVVEVLNHIINNENLSGPINLVSPNPATNYSFTKTLGKVLHRPTILPLPALLAKIIFGEMGQELLLTSIKVFPDKLLQSGYDFQNPTLEGALTNILN